MDKRNTPIKKNEIARRDYDVATGFYRTLAAWEWRSASQSFHAHLQLPSLGKEVFS